MDPPRHTRVRRVGNRCFTPACAGRARGRAARTGAPHRVGRQAGRHGRLRDGRCRVICPCRPSRASWASPTTIASNSSAGAIRWRAARTRSTPAPTSSGVVEMFAYAHAAAEARVDDDLGDVTSRLVQPDADGQRLSSEEFAFFFMILAVAGNETTRQAITHGMLAFLQHPDQWERWRLERPATAVDEILRWASPAVVLQRTATRGRRGGRPAGAQGGAGRPVLRLRQLRRGGLRRPGSIRHRPLAESPRDLRRRRLALLHRGQPLPPRAEGDVRRARRRAARRDD